MAKSLISNRKQTEVQPSQWMTPAQAAHHLGLSSTGALYQAVRRRQVPAHRLGRRLRFDRRELDQRLLGE